MKSCSESLLSSSCCWTISFWSSSCLLVLCIWSWIWFCAGDITFDGMYSGAGWIGDITVPAVEKTGWTGIAARNWGDWSRYGEPMTWVGGRWCVGIEAIGAWNVIGWTCGLLIICRWTCGWLCIKGFGEWGRLNWEKCEWGGGWLIVGCWDIDTFCFVFERWKHMN